MTGRYLCQVGILFLLGLLFWQSKNPLAILLGGFFAFMVIRKMKEVRRKAFVRGMAVLMATGFLLGCYISYQDVKRISLWEEMDLSTEYTCYGEVIGKNWKNDRMVYTLSSVTSDQGMDLGKIIFYQDADILSIGDRVRIEASLLPFSQATNEGSFDEKSFYRSQGYSYKVYEGEVRVIERESISIREWLYRLRRALFLAQADYLPGEEAGILSAITIGEKENLSIEAKDLFSMSGLSHILAISGLHVSVVGLGIYNFLRKRGMSYLTSGSIGGILVLCYGNMCGGSVSANRAVGMFLLSVIANVFGMTYDSLTGLMFMAFLTLVSNPSYLTYSGFQFSYLAVLGLLIFASPLKDTYESYCKKRYTDTHIMKKGHTFHLSLRQRIVSSVIFSFGIQIFTIPLVLNQYYVLPTYVILLNLILLPTVGVLLGLGLLGSFAGLLGPWFGPRLCFRLCHYFLYIYEVLADASLHLPASRLILGHRSKSFLIIYYLIILAVILLRRKGAKYFIPPFLILFLLLFFPTEKEMELDMLDVGQGDGIYIHTSGDMDVFVDGGSTSVTSVGRYRILPFLQYKGIQKIDYWILTHPDLDHISGFLEVVEQDYKVDTLILAEAIERDENYEEILNAAKTHGIEILYMSTGQKLSDGGASFLCLYPSASCKVEGANEKSLVLYYKDQETSVILTGDMSMDQEEEVLEMGRRIGISTLTILKVAHHGSKSATSGLFLDELMPKYAFISAGQNNSYGHPADEVVERIQNAGSKIYCTISCGRIRYTRDGIDTFVEIN